MTRPTLEEADPIAPALAEALAYWHRRRGERPMPDRADIDPVDIPKLLPWLILFDVLRDPLDFRHRLIGTQVRSRFARDYTKLRMSEIAHLKPPSSVWTLMAESANRRAPVCARVPYVGPDRHVGDVLALVLPLSADGETVDMQLVALEFNLAEDRRDQ